MLKSTLLKLEREKIEKDLATVEYFKNISLYDYTKEFWDTLEPYTFVDGWHIGAICEHLKACYDRQIRKLIINIPPRHSKSLLVSVMFPSWIWTHSPETRFITASFAEKLAIRDAMKARTLIESPLYQKHYSVIYKLADDQNAKTNYQNTKKGFRLSLGVKSSIVGEGADINICDDPNNPQKSEEAADRIETNYWLTKKWYSRVNDQSTAVRIIVQQRTHENDATGYMLSEELGFELLKIPLEYKNKKYVTSLGWKDPRETYDELINPERFPQQEVYFLKKSLGTEASGQLQQEPAPQEDGMFPPSKGTIVEKNDIPNDVEYIRYWDKAFTEGGGAYTAGVLMAKDMTEWNYYVLDVVRGQWAEDFRDEQIRIAAISDKEKYGEKVIIWIEREPGSAGRDSTNTLIKHVLSGFPVFADNPTGDKETRALPFSSQWRAGNVYLLKGDWNNDYKIELSLFPKGKYKDQVDASSGAHGKLAELFYL